jgi:cobalt-zinc-cadmium efflux system membrane fusion protein
LEHAELIHLQQRFLEAGALLKAERSRLDRTASLLKTEAASAQSFEEARADFEIARARYEGLKAELKFLGLPAEEIEAKGNIRESLPIYSPKSGVIESVEVNLGQWVLPEDPLYHIVDLSHTHLELEVFAADLGKVRIGQAVEAVVPGTGDTLRGEVYLIGPSVDPEKGTALVHGHFAEGSVQPAPGTFFQATILSEPEEHWAVPESALIRNGDTSYLFSRHGEQWRREAVRVGVLQNGWVALPDWQPDQTKDYVLKGAYYLKQLELN